MSALTDTELIAKSFVRWVAERPHHPALNVAGHTTTYGQLDSVANGIARELRSLGLTRGDRVGVRLDSVERLVPAILGILKAGGVYVPLDPSNPEARRRLVLEDCGASILLSDDGTGLDPCSVSPSHEPFETKAEPDELATIVYTSGSTGTPKGVMQSHASIATFVSDYSSAFGIGSDDRLSMLYSYSFAAANLDIFSALVHGATLCLRPLRDTGVVGLADWIARERITILHTVPTVFRQLVSCIESTQQLATVRAVDLGGEPVLSTDVERFREYFREDAVLVNHYAATELSVIAQMPIRSSTRIGPGAVPAGFPPAGVEIRVMDASGAEAPAGEPGEIVVRSARMSAGYWNQPELTARAFGPQPDEGGMRSYRTGDLGRIDDAGCLHHLGRVDDRVKIRGIGVETAEVENALLATGRVAEAVVAARESAAGSTRLVAWIVARPGSAPVVDAIRRSLAETLPDALIPSALVVLERLPLMPGGKVDRSALPEPETARNESDSAPVQPRDELESALCRMWEEITGVEKVGVDDDFFALGGDSLGAVQLFVRIERMTGKRLPLSCIMRAPTVSRMAELVRTEPGYAGAWHLAALERRGTKPPIFFVHGLRGGVVFLRELVEALGPDQPTYAFEADGRLEGRLDARSVADLAAAYVDVLRGVRPDGPYLLCGYSAGGLIAFEIARLLAGAGRKVAFLGLIDTYAPVPGRRVSGLGKKLNHVAAMWDLPSGERAAFVRSTLQRIARRERKRVGGPDVDGPLRRALLDLIDEYEPDGAYAGRVDLFRPSIPFLGARLDRALGWDRCAIAGFDVHDVPGDHRTVFEGANALALAASLTAAIERRAGLGR